jgi:hypothetical protein
MKRNQSAPRFGVSSLQKPSNNGRPRMSLEKVYEVKINREQLLDLAAMHLHAMGVGKNKEIMIVDIKGFPFSEMVPIRYKLKEVNKPVDQSGEKEDAKMV